MIESRVTIVLQRMFSVVQWIVVFGLLVPSDCFTSSRNFHSPSVARTGTSTLASVSSAPIGEVDGEHDAVVRSPMRFLGPYPTMPLRFPNLATSSQREKNITGISLDWVLDTAANVNTINAQVAKELALEIVGEAPGGVGAAGAMMGGETFMLGDCSLDINVNADTDDGEGNEDNKPELFMKGLTASALPVASPAAAGLLGLAFLYCFEGGVEFNWGNNQDSQNIPSVTFYGSTKHSDVNGLACVPFESLPVSMLPSVTLCINGKEIPALFDTGSPITVLNARAAQEAGIATTIPFEMEEKGKGGWNPFSKLSSSIQSAQMIAKATASGDILTIAGTDGTRVRLVKSANPQDVNIKTSTGQQELASAQVFVGDIPGLAALGGLGGEAPPAAVLGMDLLIKRPRVMFRAQQNEIYL